MSTMAISKFKAHALELIAQVSEQKTSIIITKQGKPIAKVVPYTPPDIEPVPGKLASVLVCENDIVSPVDLQWDADQ
jgi:prevent-host-death family protein